MSFFNKKEDVIEIQLTQHGKHLLSKGKFKPAYYAFYDDDIIYDSSYAGVTELQNEIQQRIEDTPRLKPQYVFSERKAGLIEHIREDSVRYSLQETPEKHHGLISQLGNSAIGSSNAPAWRVGFAKGEIESFQAFTDPDTQAKAQFAAQTILTTHPAIKAQFKKLHITNADGSEVVFDIDSDTAYTSSNATTIGTFAAFACLIDSIV